MTGTVSHNAACISTIEESGFFEKIDLRLGRFILETFVKDECTEIFLAAALAGRLTRSGHTCIPLKREKLEKMLPRMEEELPAAIDLSTIASWPAILLERSAAITCRDALKGAALGAEIRPLVVDEEKGLLYIYRYWAYEQRIIECITELQKSDMSLIEGCDGALIQKMIASLFPDKGPWRRAAAATAALRRFTVITGGPGTGKTTTVARVLAILLMMKPDLTIAVAAPTGKAAARIGEAITREKERMAAGRILEAISPGVNSEEILGRIPSGAATIHRLLGSKRESPYFRHDRANPLPYDIVVIDEASMVDLPLMAKTMDALREGSRLILLGDKNQLASVEIGVVFGDICSDGNVDSFSPASAAAVKGLSGVEVPSAEAKGWIEGSIVELKENFRFGGDTGIARLSGAVNRGVGDEVMGVLSGPKADVKIVWVPRTPARREGLKKALEEMIVERYEGLFGGAGIEECFECLEKFRVLSPLRKGPFGVVSLNRIIEEILGELGMIPQGARYYQGKPVIVMENDYGLHLYNGDVGVTGTDDEGGLRVYFPGGVEDPGRYRKLLPGRLPEHETVYAMTVHKSQGSEFDEVLLILPNEGSPVLTRELLYTAVTRARKRVEIWGSEEVIRRCVAERVERVSGMG